MRGSVSMLQLTQLEVHQFATIAGTERWYVKYEILQITLRC